MYYFCITMSLLNNLIFMRSIISLSLPASDKELIQLKAKTKGFSSVSQYVQFLLRQDEGLISEDQLARSVRAANREYRVGKSIKAKSIKELL